MNIENSKRLEKLDVIVKDNQSNNLLSKIEKKSTIVIGNSMIKNVHPGALKEDQIYHMKPGIRKKIDIVIILAVINDLRNNCNSINKSNEILSAIKEVDTDHTKTIASFGIIDSENHNFKDKIIDINKKLKKLL